MIKNYNRTVITIINYDCKNFIVQATGLQTGLKNQKEWFLKTFYFRTRHIVKAGSDTLKGINIFRNNVT
jgi:hypothetical protein